MRQFILTLSLLSTLAGTAQNICDELNAGFSWNASSAAGGVQFSNATTGTGQQTTWQWSFGDGATSNDAQPFHVFPGPGTYQVCLTAITIFISPNGVATTCVDDFCASVVIAGVNNCTWLNASFTWTAGLNGIEFHYQPTGPSGVQYNYLWSFGDGTTATTQNAFHTYTANGTYEVCLTVTAYTTNSSSPCTATSCQAVQWNGGNSGNICDELNASFTWASTANGVYFASTSTGLGQQTSYSWSFGDGSSGTGSPVVHVYPEPGTYEACLTVVSTYASPNGAVITCTDQYCAAVVVQGTGNSCDLLNASFTWSAASAAGGVQFSNATTGTGQQTTWQWSFGDGTTSTEAQPLHVFPGPGTYQVCLTAITIFISPNGVATTCIDDFCASVVIAGVNNCTWLNADFTWTAGLNGIEFHYQPTGPSGVQYNYLWSFGDGTTATSQNAFHTYTANGTYEVCLTVTAWTSNSTTPCTATSCQAVLWSGNNGGNACDGLNAGFTWTSTPNGVYFASTSTGLGQSTTYSWSFGDGATGSGSPVTHVYPASGTYEVCLSVVTVFITPAGVATTCVDQFCAPATVGNVDPAECDPSFALEIESEPTNTGFVLHATTNLPNQGVSWVFSNGLVLYGPSIQVGSLSNLNLELCVNAWYVPANASDTCWATVCGTLGQLGFAVGVSERDPAAVAVYPNPTSDALFINGAPTGSIRVRVFAADGRLEMERSGVGAPLRLDVEGLAPGLKWVSVLAGGREHRFKVVKE